VSFTFIDLFAGIGGFHAALAELGGTCTWASEIDPEAVEIYKLNWDLSPAGDIVPLTDPDVDPSIGDHDVLAAGFPCQPFSKSGKQQGFRDTTRGTLFFNICQILDARQPPLVVLENVRNLAGPRQRDTWNTIISELRNLGYQVSDQPAVFSPHLLPPERGGSPQVRERVFIVGVHVGREQAWANTDLPPVVTPHPVDGFNPQTWDISRYLEDDISIPDIEKYRLSESEVRWIDAWDDFIDALRQDGLDRLPGFPIWADHLCDRMPPRYRELPAWKVNFLTKNRDLYREHRSVIDKWYSRWSGLEGFPASRRKLEWQAQDAGGLWDCIMHFRPSGIRAKKPTYVPALVAITQTSIYGPRRRRLTPNEAKALQGLPEWFSFGEQRDAASYKQLGNGVSVGAVTHVMRRAVEEYRSDLLRVAPHVVHSVESVFTPSIHHTAMLAAGH
jgi:DNA (cytosine-5)-methyltransferase 1